VVLRVRPTIQPPLSPLLLFWMVTICAPTEDSVWNRSDTGSSSLWQHPDLHVACAVSARLTLGCGVCSWRRSAGKRLVMVLRRLRAFVWF